MVRRIPIQIGILLHQVSKDVANALEVKNVAYKYAKEPV